MLKTDNIRLRKVEPKDLPFLYRWENDTQAWTSGDTHNPLSQKDLRDYLTSSTGDIYKDGQLRLIMETTDPEPYILGCIDLYDFNPHHGKAAVGIYVDDTVRKKGVGKVALELLEDYAFGFLHLQMLYAFIASSNEASHRLFLSRGWQHTATLPCWLGSESAGLWQKMFPAG